MEKGFDYYYDLYVDISLQDYLKDKSVEEIINTYYWLNCCNEPVFMEMLAYFNREPADDLKYTEATDKFCDNRIVCSKCLFPHDNSHKCYAYDRIFRDIICNYNIDNVDDYYLCCRNTSSTCYNVLNHDKIGRYNYSERDYGCRGTEKIFIRVGSTWFERKCHDCRVMKQITLKEVDYW